MKKIFKWFKGKKSKGGSQILEYDTEGTDLIGVQEDFDEKLREEREKIFDELFGHSESVSHEIMPLVPHIDILTSMRRISLSITQFRMVSLQNRTLKIAPWIQSCLFHR